MRRAFVVLTIFVAAVSCRRPELETSTILWRAGEWKTPQGAQKIRLAPAVFISFRKSGEYIEHYSRVIEQQDQSVYLSSSDPHVITIGRWKRRRNEVIVTRQIVSKNATRLCGEVRYRVEEGAVTNSEGRYTPITQLVAPDFESYISDTKRTGTQCPQPSS